MREPQVRWNMTPRDMLTELSVRTNRRGPPTQVGFATDTVADGAPSPFQRIGRGETDSSPCGHSGRDRY